MYIVIATATESQLKKLSSKLIDCVNSFKIK